VIRERVTTGGGGILIVAYSIVRKELKEVRRSYYTVFVKVSYTGRQDARGICRVLRKQGVYKPVPI
jgi:hypothetical protein